MTEEELKLYNFRLYPSLVAEIDELVKSDRNVSSRTDWVRQKLEYLITHDLVNQLPGDIDTESIVKEIMMHLGDRIQTHEDRMYTRVAKLEQTLGHIILKVEQQDPQTAELVNYLDAISNQLFVDQLERTLQITLPSKLVALLKYPWYGDYLADWINLQQQYGTLQYDGRVIRWNRDRIEEVYFSE